MTEPPPPPPVPQTYRIVVGIDYSELSAAALEAAMVLALERDGMIYALTVAEDGLPRPAELMEEVRQKFQEEARGALDAYVTQRVAEFEGRGFKLNKKRIASAVDFGKPAKAIVDLAAEVGADLIIVGTHGRTGLSRLMLGSVAEATVKEATCPVLVMRPKAHSPK
ncbi:MAG: universal stress protein [Polyangiaceae bacterium]